MADLLKSIVKLEVGGDGRTAENYNSYKVQLENALSAKEMQGVYLDDILLNTGAGAQVANPGTSEAEWIAAAPRGDLRDGALFAQATANYSKWARANRVTHSYIMATLPPVLHEECAQRTNAHELWAYLEQRFAAQTLASVAAMWGRLLQLRLDDYAGVSAFLTAITKLEMEIKRGGVEVHDTLLAGAILNGMGDRYPTTKELLLTLPIAQQTKDVFGERLLEAEKNAKLTIDMAMATTTHNAYAAAANVRGGCGYVRQRQGKGQNAKPGTKCTRGNHKRKDCWALLDDQFLAANPGKGPGDLPNRLAELRARQGQVKGNAEAMSTTFEGSPCVDVNVAAINVSGLSFDYSCSVGKKETAASIQHKGGREVIVALDSGATTPCWKEKVKHEALPSPVRVNGASEDMVAYARGTSVLPCPAVPEKELKGIYSPDFRHNLVAVSALQKKGVEVTFPPFKAHAECKDPSTGQVLWTFKQSQNGLYEATLQLPPSDEFAGAASTVCQCNSHSLQHPSILLHYRLGHMSEAYMKTLISKGDVKGLPKSFTPLPKELHSSCEPCIEAKTQAKPHPNMRSRATRPLEKVHVDLVGPLPTTLRGERYWLTIVDDYSRHGWTVLLHTKDQAKLRIIEWIALQERQTQHKVKHVHGDRGGEFLNNVLLGHLKSMGVEYTFSNPDSPQQNGVAEARNKATGRILRALLLQSEAPRSLWGYAVSHATYLNNLFPHGLLEGRTPYEEWHQTPPSIQRLKVWGCTGHVLMNKDERRKHGGKLGPVTKPCVLVGINPLGPGWLLLDGSTNREIPSSDVVFQEEVPYYRRRADREEEQQLDWFVFGDDIPQGTQTTPLPTGASIPPPTLPQQAPPSASPPAPSTPPVAVGPTPPEITQDSSLPLPTIPEEPPAPAQQPPTQLQRSLRRSLRSQGRDPTGLPKTNVKWAGAKVVTCPGELPLNVHALIQVIAQGESGDKKEEIPVPSTVEEALSGPHGAEWMESMIREYKGIEETGTLEAVPRSMAKNVIKCKWVYRVKRRPDGQPHFKSRLVAKGFSQKHGVDFFETWAPTARHTTARVFLHLAAVKDMEVHAMDVDQAFLQGSLQEEIFMEPAPSMPTPPGENHVWKLRRPLYGLKQAPRQWHAKLKVALLQLGFKPSHGDPSLYIGETKSATWILVYVDDLLMACKDPQELSFLKDELKKHFPMKDLGEVSTYLGMELHRDREAKTISLSQKKYVEELVAKFGLQETKPAPTPIQVNHGLSLPQEGEEVHPDQDRFAELLGGIMYLMVCTRPDIAHAVSVLSRFIAPGRNGAQHWKAALRLLSYLKGTADYALQLGGRIAVLQGHSDSSWADDQVDRRSSQGYTFDLGAGAISWRATRSPAVALSTCEAELYAGTSAAQESVWLMGLLNELGHQQQTPILWCDNQSTVAMTKDPIFSGRSKHIEARYFFIRELVQAGKVQAKHIPGCDNVADIFTKPLSKEDHYRLMEKLGVKQLPTTAAACLPGGVLQGAVEGTLG